jgi:dTDP-4-amino-4,6-dideoxygalactose transaminase
MNAYGVVGEFEKRVAEFAGARYGIAVDCCTSGILLCCAYLEVEEVICPARTYISVPMAVIHSGGKVRFEDFDWRGVYQLKPYPIFDGAKRFRRAMYRGGYHCLSFHLKKHIPIGRGGMILTDDEEAADWFRKARYDGREGKPYDQEKVSMMGYHCYMTPEQAARGLALMDVMNPDLPDLTEDYPDLRQMPVFQ